MAYPVLVNAWGVDTSMLAIQLLDARVYFIRVQKPVYPLQMKQALRQAYLLNNS
jgi:hypothetical protein